MKKSISLLVSLSILLCMCSCGTTSNSAESYTNQIPLSVDADGNTYNGTGFKNNTRLRSTGEEADTSSDGGHSFVTGFIPVKPGDTIYLGGNILSGESGAFNTYGYGSDKKTIVFGFTPYAWANGTMDQYAPYVYDSSSHILHSFTVPDGDIAYMRFSLLGHGANAVITVNETIPTDNSAQLATLEEEIAQLEAAIATLTQGQEYTVPTYWADAVDALDDTVQEKQNTGGVRAFQFLWASDIHGVNGYTSDSAGTSKTKDIGNIAAYVLEKYDLPFFAISGDIMSQASHTNIESVYAEYDAIHKMLAPVPINRLLAVMGNHDGSWGEPQNDVYYLKYIGDRAIWNEIYRPQSLDSSRVFGGNGTYFYVDSPQKVRFIMLNSQTNGDGSVDAHGNAVYNAQKYSVYGTEQLAWLADTALDMPEGWTAVIMAHAPLSWSKDGALLAGLIDAYNNRTSYSGTADARDTWWDNGAADTTYTQIAVNADFSEAKGEVAAFFHGHIHKDTIDNTTYSFPTISITTAGADVRDTDPPLRTPDTATETAMDIVTLDMENRMIYLTRLGVGSDRETKY